MNNNVERSIKVSSRKVKITLGQPYTLMEVERDEIKVTVGGRQ